MNPANEEVMNQLFKDLRTGRVQWINGDHAENEMWCVVRVNDEEQKVVLTATVD